MEYSIHDFAALAGLSTRTLRWYHEIGLLNPARIGENGYRIYTSAEADRLQHILFYRALGVELSQIKQILDDPSFDRLAALRSHLDALQNERAQITSLIRNVQQSIRAEERKEFMSDAAKFEAFKKELVEQNEKKYGAEIRAKYGDESIDASNKRMMGLSPEEFERWNAIGDEIRTRLTAAVSANANPADAEGQAIAALHREWLCFSWKQYTPEAHIGVASMYSLDDRFRAYYDAEIDGCAEFLRDAVLSMLK